MNKILHLTFKRNLTSVAFSELVNKHLNSALSCLLALNFKIEFSTIYVLPFDAVQLYLASGFERAVKLSTKFVFSVTSITLGGDFMISGAT